MKTEKAIEILKGLELHYGNANVMKQPLQLAIQALEKQLPKTPLFEDNGGYPEYFEHWLACPICDEAIPEYTAENNTWCYCLECGQLLDWSDENK